MVFGIMKHSSLVILLVVVYLTTALAESRCLKPTSPQFGGWHASKQSFNVGTVVTYYCLPGYTLVGSKTVVCATDLFHAFWVGDIPRCVHHAGGSCSDPGFPGNGKRILGGTRVGDKVQFVCHEGFELQGSAELICQDNGKWSGSIPTCIKAIHCPDPGTPLNGHRVMTDTSIGAVVTFSCSHGYRLIGEASIICHNSGQWSRAKPSCRKIEVACPDPGTPENGRRQIESLHGGSTVHYSCFDGYKLVGESKRTCHSGRWTGSLPSCSAIDCHTPNTPQNGLIHFQATTLNEKVVHSCKAGYVLIGASFRACQANGLWSGSSPLCVPIDCGYPENVKNGGRSLSDGTLVNSVVTYYCNTGYALQGSETRRCASNGRWTGTAPECIKHIDCGQLKAPSNGGVKVDGITIGAGAVYYCNEGFTLSGEVHRTCKPNGRWSASVPSCNIIDCGDPGAPRNGVRELSSTVFRSAVQYSCNYGYNLVGDKVRFCLASGEWSGFLPVCKLVNCGDPGTPENGRRELSSTTFHAAVIYTCNHGFSLVGSALRICKASGEWSGSVPTCKKTVTGCGNPGVPINGRSDYRDFKFGSILTHSCNAGFVLRGDRLRQCLPTGMWSGSLPTCQSVSCGDPGSVANGNVIYTDNVVGSRVRVECNAGFLLNGKPERVCLSDGHWSGGLPTCEAIDCGDPATVKNGRRELSGTSFGNTVKYFCDDGFTLIGSSVRRCRRNGQWSGSVPECQKVIVDCGQPEPIGFGSVDTVATTEDSEAVYTCQSGYKLVGSSVRICLSSGRWSGRKPVCNIIDCGSPKPPVNGFVDFSRSTFSSEALYTCKPGHRLIGDKVRRCEITGAWLGTIPTCQIVSCRDPGTPANGIVLSHTNGIAAGSVVTYGCNQGYILVGAGSRVCRANGVWSVKLPICKALLCGDPGRPVNGKKIVTAHTIGSEVLFTCNTGYSLIGDSVRTCQPDQTWSGSVPLCVLVNCGDPGLSLNTIRSFSRTTFNAVVTYSCSANFMLSGESTRVCQADGKWSGAVPTCELKDSSMCGDPGIPENGQRVITSNLVTAVVTFSCNSGYFLVGDTQRTCLPSGQWSGATPSCEVIDCGNPGKPRNGIVIGNDYRFGATVEYKCINGYILVGVKSRYCQEDGTWSSDRPFCKENAATQCDDPGVPDNGRRIGNDLKIGSTIYFQCFDGYELVGETSNECLPGAIWSARGPFCRIITDTCNGEGIEVFDSCGRKCTCRGGFTTECCRLRKDWATMSFVDRRLYLDAVIQVSTDPKYKPQYDSLILLYHQLANSLVHNSNPFVSQFIPWHRYFLIEYENLLKQINCNITVPYWDWTGLAKNPYAADVFDIGHGFGDSSRLTDHCVNIGPFSVDKWVLPAAIGGGCLKREYQLKTFPTRDYIERDLLPYPASNFVILHHSLQLVIHNLVRCTIGGTMCTAGDSAADPLYVLHLSRIDSIYSHWQDLKMGRQLIRYAEDNSVLVGAGNLVVSELSSNQQLPYGISVCYDPPFELKNFQPAKRSTKSSCIDAAEMDSMRLSELEKETIHKMCGNSE